MEDTWQIDFLITYPLDFLIKWHGTTGHHLVGLWKLRFKYGLDNKESIDLWTKRLHNINSAIEYKTADVWSRA